METTQTSAAAPAAAAPSSSAAPVSTATPTAAATPAPVADGAGGAGALDPASSMQAMVEAAAKQGYGDTLEEKPAEVPAAAVTETPAAKAEETPAAAATEGNGTPAEEEPSYSLDEDGFVGAKDLASKIDANPALKAALDAETRNEILANARLAEVGAAYRELFASPEEAKIVAETAQEHAGFVEAFNILATDPTKGADAVIVKLIEAGAKRDADGNIMRDANGQPITNGIAGRFFDQIFNRALTSKILKKVEALGDENVTAALDLVMESVGLRPSTAGKTDNQDPVLAARKAELDRQQAEITRQREAATQEQRTQYDNALRGDLASLYEREVGKLLGLATGLDPFAREAVEQKLEQSIRQAIRTNTAYQMRKDRLQAMPLSPERRAKEVALANEFFRDNLTRVAAPILKQAGIMAKGKASERAAASAARAEGARSEVSGGRAAAPGTGHAGASPAQIQAQAIADFKAKNGGREPSDSELNIAMMLAAVENKGRAA